MAKAQATVKIELSINAANVPDFLREWEDIKDALRSQAGIESAVIELPADIRTIELDVL